LDGDVTDVISIYIHYVKDPRALKHKMPATIGILPIITLYDTHENKIKLSNDNHIFS
jgi:hypothetical protein